MTGNTYITYPGDAGSPLTFGGTPFHITQALRGVVANARSLVLPLGRGQARRRYLWNLKELFTGRGVGGFQYSDEYLDRLWGQISPFNHGDVIINIFQLYSRSYVGKTNANLTYYIDQTLRQCFAGNASALRPRHVHVTEAIAQERKLYQRATKIVCLTEWAAHSLRNDYGISASKVAVCPPGANVNDELVNAILANDPITDMPLYRFDRDHPLKLVFVGKDPVRKGLYRLLDAVTALGADADAVTVTAIGTPAPSITLRYRCHPRAVWRGFIDKSRHFAAFQAALTESHLGVLLSTAEPAGLSLREFQLFGLGVIAPNVDGSPEMLAPGAGILVEPYADAATIAQQLRQFIAEPSRVAALRAAAAANRINMTWRHHMPTLAELVGAASF